MATDIPSFDELLGLLRVRLQLADDVNVGELHSFKVLMADKANVVSDAWYWDAFAELQAQGHLDTPSSLGNERLHVAAGFWPDHGLFRSQRKPRTSQKRLGFAVESAHS